MPNPIKRRPTAADLAGAEIGRFDVNFGYGDAMAVGDAQLGGKSEIIVADAGGTISVYDGAGSLLQSFASAYDANDLLAAGDVLSETTNNGQAEIIVASPSADRIHLYSGDGADHTWIHYRLGAGDSMAVGNVCDIGNCLVARDDIIIGESQGGIVRI